MLHQRCNQWRAVFIAHKTHSVQVDADTCKYQHHKTLKHWPLICKTQTINSMKWIKLQVSLLVCKAYVFEQNCDAYTQYKAFKWSNTHTGLFLLLFFGFYRKRHQIIEIRRSQNAVNWSFKRSSPCLLGHLILVRSGQLIQVGLQNGLHFLMVGRAERGRWGLVEGSCCRRGGSSSQGRSGTSLLFYLIVQILVAVGLDRHGRGPAVAVISGMWTECFLY